MARSRRKTPICGVAADSNKEFKSKEHRRERRKVRQMLTKSEDDYNLPSPKKYGNSWDSPKDGQIYFGDYKFPSTYKMLYPTDNVELAYQEMLNSYHKLMRK